MTAKCARLACKVGIADKSTHQKRSLTIKVTPTLTKTHANRSAT
ncbi:hypothetical protein [Nostoc sp. FACHB-133]|nr:hypothetical protein [Nostoc sp. FACHB-133]